MSLMQCPDCKKKISVDAAACPKCGKPITEEHVAKHKADQKTAKKGCLVLLVIFLGFGLWAFLKDSKDLPTRDVVSASIKPGLSMGSTEVADLYGGKAVLSNNGGAWWVQDGRVFAANGTASTLSPDAPWSPPSVDFSAVQRAIKGEQFLLPPTLAMTMEEFDHRLMVAVSELPHFSVQRDGLVYYHAVVGTEKVAKLKITEVGGLLTEVTAFAMLDKDKQSASRLAAVGLVMAPLYVFLGEEGQRAAAQALFRSSETPVQHTAGHLKFEMVKGAYEGQPTLALTVTPAL